MMTHTFLVVIGWTPSSTKILRNVVKVEFDPLWQNFLDQRMFKDYQIWYVDAA